MDQWKTVLYEEERGVVTITLNRPDKRNAISYELIDDLTAALAVAARSDCQIVILTGAGKAFCSGMDLDNLAQITKRSHDDNLKDSETMGRLFRTIYDFPKPTIAAVNGPAIAGGCGIATLCDFTIASEEAKFGYTEVKIGFIPAIVSTFLIRQIGEKRARDLLLTGRIIDAKEAHAIGLVTDVVAAHELPRWCRELAAQLMENSPASLRSIKELLGTFAQEDLDGHIKEAVTENARIRTTDDFREGVTSFLEKRKPKWSGK